MVKEFCDICGRENTVPLVFDFKIQQGNAHYVLCRACSDKFQKFFDEMKKSKGQLVWSVTKR